MAPRALEQSVEHLECRVASVEQIVPTLATKPDLAELKVELTTTLRAEWKAETGRRRPDRDPCRPRRIPAPDDRRPTRHP